MDVYIRKYNERGETYSQDNIFSVAQHEIGHALGFSKERIRQIENVALQKLRKVNNVDTLKSYLDVG